MATFDDIPVGVLFINGGSFHFAKREDGGVAAIRLDFVIDLESTQEDADEALGLSFLSWESHFGKSWKMNCKWHPLVNYILYSVFMENHHHFKWENSL